jgi:hypothetical protein
MHPPGTPSSYRFFSFQSPVIDQGYVFFASSSNGVGPFYFGIYIRNGNGFLKLVDRNTAIPGGGGKFFPFDQVPIIAAKNGIVVFLSADASNQYGIYAVRETGGPITKIVARGDVIGGRTVDQIQMWRDGFDGKNLVFYVTYGAYGTGIYSTQVVLP